MKVEEAIKVLTEFNKWRRGLPPYGWNEDPSRQEDLQYSAKEIGVAIDEAVDMLRQSAGMMGREEKREKKYEYTVMYEDGAVSRLHYDFVEPLNYGRYEHHRLIRREVGEWEEVKE